MKRLSQQVWIIAVVSLIASMMSAQELLIGTTRGIFTVSDGKPVLLTEFPSDIECRKILKTDRGWYFLTNMGILYSRDLQTYEMRNNKLPVKIIKQIHNGQKKLVEIIHELKDLEYDPYNHEILVTCTKDAAYISYDGGKNWTSLGNPSDSNGIKAVAVLSSPQLTVLLSSAVRGLFMRELPKGSWKRAKGNFAQSCPTTSPDEIADIQVAKGEQGPVIWAVNSFLPVIYRATGTDYTFERVFSAQTDFFSMDSLSLTQTGFFAVSNHQLLRYTAATGLTQAVQEQTLLLKLKTLVPERILSLYCSGHQSNESKTVATAAVKSDFSALPALSLSELWFFAERELNPYTARAANKNGIYLQTGYIINEQTRKKYIELMNRNNINMLTIDLKDDYGRLRYISNDPLVKSMYKPGSTIDIDAFTKEMKAAGIYLVARIVVFKDQHMYQYGNGKYAVYDAKNKTPWRGYRWASTGTASASQASTTTAAPANPNTATQTAGNNSNSAAVPVTTQPAASNTQPAQEKIYYGEYWVDPYCEYIWEYNVAIAREVLARGFDEVQFDYIRFPTDGVNIGDASYRWKDAGMDKESALLSFLKYAREQIPGPISIDIYGVNGWYRSGVRTGQDVELLSRYVDVICPMFYPSHFEQNFLAFAPAEMRPYRIYKLGSLRTWTIGKKRIVVRPYVQAFYMNVSYDRLYYSPAYVAKEVEGIYQALNQGMTFWNNVGRYDDIPILQAPDPGYATEIKQNVLD
ncbi:MAG TPA: putative glycoside hydrolase [Spirochaetia bacterium]|nr:putative glycoside hydrolase [Spirochaetia bacterium]